MIYNLTELNKYIRTGEDIPEFIKALSDVYIQRAGFSQISLIYKCTCGCHVLASRVDRKLSERSNKNTRLSLLNLTSILSGICSTYDSIEYICEIASGKDQYFQQWLRACGVYNSSLTQSMVWVETETPLRNKMDEIDQLT